MNANGNHPVFPTRPNGNRDIDESRELKDTWKDMEAMVKKGEFHLQQHAEQRSLKKERNIGKVKSIGASNFSQMMLEKVLPTAEIVPTVNQVCYLGP